MKLLVKKPILIPCLNPKLAAILAFSSCSPGLHLLSSPSFSRSSFGSHLLPSLLYSYFSLSLCLLLSPSSWCFFPGLHPLPLPSSWFLLLSLSSSSCFSLSSLYCLYPHLHVLLLVCICHHCLSSSCLSIS